MRQPVVPQISRLVADHLDDDREEWNGKDERREQEVELRNHPDGDAAPDDRKGTVLRLLVGFCPQLRLRVGLLGGLSLRAGHCVGGGGRSLVRLLVLAARQARGHLDDADEQHEDDEGTDKGQQFAVHRGVSLT